MSPHSRFTQHGWLISLIGLLFLVVLSTGAKADDISENDAIMLQLSERQWVKAEKALVTIVIDTAMDSEKSKGLQADVQKALSSVAASVDWQLTGFSRQADNAGLERWHVTAEGRLTEDQLAGMEQRAEKASRPGIQVRVAQVAFTPSPAEIEAARKSLRRAIYARVMEELEQIQAVMPERKFRVGMVDFTNGVMPIAQPRLYAQKASMDSGMRAESMSVQGGSMNTGRELVQDAMVRLVASAP